MLRAPERAVEGRERIEWVRRNMPILASLEDRFAEERPLAGLRVTVSVHLEAKTAYLALVLRAAGARVSVCGSNPESTRDEVAAALAAEGLHVYAERGVDDARLRTNMLRALAFRPHLVVDDGGDLVELLHEQPELAAAMLGACEETTTGVARARARAASGSLRFPVLLINDARCKYLFDNVHGTGQSVWDAIMRTTNLTIAGKTVVVVGFGWCGQGCALRAAGLGARVVVCEIDPVKAADAALRGYTVKPLLAACEEADLLLTATGVAGTVGDAAFTRLRDGALLANAGHFWTEIDRRALFARAVERRRLREQVEGLRMADGRWLHLLGNGEIVNIACGDGHPAEIMDTSFALQALSVEHLARHHGELSATTHPVPEEIDLQVARAKLAAMRIEIDSPAPTAAVGGAG
ncbi:MAG: adenosylhomocysteinase [Acidobacteria bacterium]|nr:MAG: adenosylhomocysteinase [Acidobacteriota bacterium]REK01128.1 MAG: adenosylhomocysteinase [Acidobacteriota bacterium]